MKRTAHTISPTGFETADCRWQIEVTDEGTLTLTRHWDLSEKETMLIDIDMNDLEVLIELLIRAREIDVRQWEGNKC
jgi:hypothetical protein